MWEYPEYVPVAKKRENAEKQLLKLKKKRPDIKPVKILGNKLANTWWGIAWNKNLESYADYSNRIGRGRSYLRNGCVIDLQIDTGAVSAIVHGSGTRPYNINITINPLPDKKWTEITNECSNSIANLEELVSGKFPKALEELFTQREKGLFPSPGEIKFDCDCPDWAYMCKHVAAALYGIGTRFDDDPTLFFKLRNIQFEELLKKSIEAKMTSMLENADKKSKRVIEDANIEGLFGL